MWVLESATKAQPLIAKQKANPEDLGRPQYSTQGLSLRFSYSVASIITARRRFHHSPGVSPPRLGVRPGNRSADVARFVATPHGALSACTAGNTRPACGHHPQRRRSHGLSRPSLLWRPRDFASIWLADTFTYSLGMRGVGFPLDGRVVLTAPRPFPDQFDGNPADQNRRQRRTDPPRRYGIALKPTPADAPGRIGAVLKTAVRLRRTGGSNPSPSASLPLAERTDHDPRRA